MEEEGGGEKEGFGITLTSVPLPHHGVGQGGRGAVWARVERVKFTDGERGGGGT